MANHMKTHERDVKSSSLLAFVKRAPAKQTAVITIKKSEQEPLQVKLSFSKRKHESSMNVDKIGSRLEEDLSPYVIPPSVIPSDADPQTPEYRITVVKYYHRLKHTYPSLSKATFYRANNFEIKQQRFYQFFTEHDKN